ncbi:two-component system sensor histidine kinase NtrB [Desulfovibrio cuneatus]|uniref:two-component system sensor histidine kinase NtrB n=1 Tax=Desulfovibrio cuneatus TaxID=159728 RepID=UPI000A05F638|nr:ATP-binding protein [Desulfovibrio cuneatus]
MVNHLPSIEDVLGVSQTKLGFYSEWQRKMVELRKAHAASEHQRLANQAILEGIADLMMVLDEELRIVSVNRVFHSLFPNEDVVGKFCHQFFHARGGVCPGCPALRSLHSGDVCRETAIFHVHDKTMHFDMVASPLPGEQGRGVLVFKRDVTLQKQMQAQMYQTEKMASVGMLAAGVAHEINNPLTAVSGFAEGIKRRLPLLEDTVPEELRRDLAEYTDTIVRECIRCRDIVQTLMNFSRSAPLLRLVCLHSLIEETLSLLRHNIKLHHRVLFCLDLASGLPKIYADDTQLRQVLLNLVTNALDAVSAAGEEGGTGVITVRTRVEQGEVVLEVEDSGKGIAQENLASVFEPFFTTKPKGLGLGLSMCYTMVQAHGGRIALASTPQGATCASVRLPLAGEGINTPAGEGEGLATGPGTGRGVYGG